VGVNAFHRSSHLQQMDCQVCHAQPYKNCFGCHTDVTAQSVAYFKINEGDPTLAARKAASSNPATVFPDALMTLRVGKNPRWGEPGQRKYALLRHVPIDADTFSYSGANEVGGLVPGMTALPTWKRATPHNIVRSAPIASSCANCHFGEYARFWLTDALGDADGWVPGAYAADEAAANAPVLQGAPVDLLTPPP
jgi:thiosulfate/3-mercaptopyruvate sulfurtransferase